jgi:hypothetical protein
MDINRDNLTKMVRMPAFVKKISISKNSPCTSVPHHIHLPPPSILMAKTTLLVLDRHLHRLRDLPKLAPVSHALLSGLHLLCALHWLAPPPMHPPWWPPSLACLSKWPPPPTLMGIKVHDLLSGQDNSPFGGDFAYMIWLLVTKTQTCNRSTTPPLVINCTLPDRPCHEG